MKTRLAALALACALLMTGCSRIVDDEPRPAVVFASFYPVYALCELALTGINGISVACLTQPQDDCLRSYELSDWDIYTLAYSADIVVVAGRGLEGFESALYSMGDNGPVLISAMSGLSLFNDSDRTTATEDTGHLVGANPHLYMSIRGARNMTVNILSGFAELFPELSNELIASGDAALARLDALYSETREICAPCAGEGVIIMHEALIYPALEYGLNVRYWCDRESGASYYGAKLDELIAEMQESGARVAFIEKHASPALVTAIEAAGIRVAKLDIITGYTAADGAEAYFAAQLDNARAIASAFSE